MTPPLIFLLAILTPFIITAALLVPLYAGVLGAAYIIYLPAAGAAHPLAGRLADVFYILAAYIQLLEYWLAHMGAVSFVHYTLPVVGLPLVAAIIALFITYRVAVGLLNLFRMSTSGH